MIIHNWLVVSTPLKNMNVNWDDYSQYFWQNKIDVPNHQPDNYYFQVFSIIFHPVPRVPRKLRPPVNLKVGAPIELQREQQQPQHNAQRHQDEVGEVAGSHGSFPATLAIYLLDVYVHI